MEGEAVTLHLTSCIRASDISPTEALDLAKDIENGDLVLAQTSWELDEQDDPVETLVECVTLRQRHTVIEALRAFA